MNHTLPLSALQHYMYCPRQCAMIHVEKVWVENRFTAEGRIMHQRVDSKQKGQRAGVFQDFSVPLRSDRLGLYGVADVIEREILEDDTKILFPVEYKRGSPKIDDCDRLQLCAQGMCLEEMLGIEVTEGAIFYGKPRRREIVVFDEKLKAKVEEIAMLLHNMVEDKITPAAEKSNKCKGCSLRETCMPGSQATSVESYLTKGLNT